MDQKKGVVRGICISKKRGTAKYPVESARIVPDWGIEEDAHGGKWHRQISLLALEKIEAFREQGSRCGFRGIWRESDHRGIRLEKCSGRFRDTDRGYCQTESYTDWKRNVTAIVQSIGGWGDCIMPREGIFAEVLEGGNICVGDSVEVQNAAGKPAIQHCGDHTE